MPKKYMYKFKFELEELVALKELEKALMKGCILDKFKNIISKVINLNNPLNEGDIKDYQKLRKEMVDYNMEIDMFDEIILNITANNKFYRLNYCSLVN